MESFNFQGMDLSGKRKERKIQRKFFTCFRGNWRGRSGIGGLGFSSSRGNPRLKTEGKGKGKREEISFSLFPRKNVRVSENGRRDCGLLLKGRNWTLFSDGSAPYIGERVGFFFFCFFFSPFLSLGLAFGFSARSWKMQVNCGSINGV